MAPIRIEAEDMALTNYLVESGNTAASGQTLISLWKATSSTGSATTTFTGASGTYDVVVAYFDENDGQSPYAFSVGANQYNWTATKSLGSGSATSQTLVRRAVASGISVNAGDAINLTGTANQGEWARVDYIEFIPVASPTPTPPPADTTAPTASLAAANITAGNGTSHTFTVTYNDNAGVNISSLDGNDLLVSGPNSFSQAATLVSVDTNSNGTPRTATYRINAAGGTWDAADNGTYTIAMQTSQVSDTSNNFVQSGSLGSFQVNVPATPSPSPAPAPSPAPSPAPTPAPSGSPLRIEAETMTPTTYLVESNTAASGGKLLSLFQSGGTTGTAATTFTGASGTYDVVVAYFDENDGQSPYAFSVGANQYNWTATKSLGSGSATSQTLVRRAVASGISINAGDAINLTGTVNQGEWARVDYIEFIPVANSSPSTINGTESADTLNGNAQNNIINGLGGNDTLNGGDGNDTLDGGAGNNILNGGNGTDTVSYASSIGGVIVNLDTGLVNRKFATSSTTALKIMPLGDSNTRGKEQGVNSPNRAGYRDDLWAFFKDGGFNINFVGSAAPEGPNTVTGQNGTYTFDKNHDGYGGYAIKGAGALGEILPNVNTWLNAARPDVVMLMAGTNDFIFQNTTASATIAELGELIDTIFAGSPNVNLFVSTIAPISTTNSYSQEAANYNNLIPDLLAQSKYQGKNLTLVDTRNILGQGDLWDGIHLTNNAYTRQADAWYDAILNKGNGKDTLTTVENIVGSGYDDELTGNLGVNVINGGAGNDLIRGGGGNDQLTGGSGNDRFVLAVAEGIDTVTDFVVSQDLLALSGGLTFDQLSIIQGSGANANDTLVNLNTGEQLAILSGLQASTITTNSFTVV